MNRICELRTEPTARNRWRATCLGLGVLLLTSCGGMRYNAGFNPTVTVEVEHAASIGVVINEVVFDTASSQGSDTCEAESVEFVQALTQMLVEGGLRVTSYDNRQEADAMIRVGVTRCDVEQDSTETSREVIEEYRGETRRRNVPTYHTRTRVSFRSLFEVTDLSTDRLAVTRTLTFDPDVVASSGEQYPDYPPTGQVLEQAYSMATEAIRPMLLRWAETRELVYFDDERCGLNLAFRALEAGNYDRALQLSMANVESCRPDPEGEITEMDVAAANYNVGVLYRIRGDFESAMTSLERAEAADPNNSVIRRAIDEALTAEAAAAEVRQAEEAAAARALQLQEEARERAGRVITNPQVVQMFKDDLADEIIIQVIQTSEVDFDVSPEALVELNREGLSAAVISAMVAAAGRF